MDTTAEAVDELFRVTYKGITYTFRLAEELLAGGGKLVAGAAHGGAALAGIFAALKHQEYRTKGAVKFENLLQRGKGFAQFDITHRCRLQCLYHQFPLSSLNSCPDLCHLSEWYSR